MALLLGPRRALLIPKKVAAAGGGVIAATTLDPAHKGASASVGADKLTYTTTAAESAVRGLIPVATGKYKCEITFGATHTGSWGFVDGSWTLDGQFLGNTWSSWGFGSDGFPGTYQVVGGGGNTGDTPQPGDTVAMEFDVDAKLAYLVTPRGRYGPYPVNGGGMPGPYYFAFSQNSTSETWHINFGSTPFVLPNGGGFSGLS
ncbi:MAG TPA: hypothetical protein VNW53_11705 [Phenylobacterium sp.]|jgi:hypothetical protein|uniref:hypothetical protein n=1 Tax=Phenylobacterium sp. TaxID=1871053 RepID=UPI002C00C67A|nr:hypothetical protein [Phenylobacterium sp.]HXA39658.1 hypothetical protein [Phenylobacterium sp.]